MVTEFNTSSSTPSKGGNTIWIVLGLAVAGYFAYRFLIKPKKDEQEQK